MTHFDPFRSRNNVFVNVSGLGKFVDRKDRGFDTRRSIHVFGHKVQTQDKSTDYNCRNQEIRNSVIMMNSVSLPDRLSINLYSQISSSVFKLECSYASEMK